MTIFQKLKDIKTPSDASRNRRLFGGALWLIATARNALLVFFTSFMAYFAAKQGKTPFILTGTVRSGLPDVAMPPFSTIRDGPNGTHVEMGFQDMVRGQLVSLWSIFINKISF